MSENTQVKNNQSTCLKHNWLEPHECPYCKIESLEDEVSASHREARALALSMFTKHWKEEYRRSGLAWEMLNNPSGIITQINNMVAGLEDLINKQSSDLVKLKESNSIMHGMLIEIRTKLNAWDTPTAPTDRDIVGVVS